MKKYIILFLFFVSQISISQTELKVLVYDKDTNTTLAFANIFLQENKIGGATDIDGFTSINIKNNFTKKDILKCSYIGYKEELISISLPIKDTLKIYMLSKHISLNEVAISVKIDRSNGLELVTKAIKNIQTNYGKELSNLDTFYEEKVFANKKLIELNQSLNTIIYDGYPQKGYAKSGYKKYWKFETIEEYEIFRTNNTRQTILLGFPQYFKYYNSKKDKAIIKTKRISDNKLKDSVFIEINGGPLALTSLDKVKFLADYLDPKLLDEYNYIRKNSKQINGERCFAVGFKPKSRKKINTQRWDKKMGFAVYSGTIYISKSDYAVVSIESTLEINESIEHYGKNLSWQVFPTTISAKIDYTKTDHSNWRLKSIYSYQFIKAGEKIYKIKDDYICERKLVVFDQIFSESAITDGDVDNRLLRDIEFSNLRNFPSNYNRESWLKYNEQIPVLSKKEIDDLGGKIGLAEQFEKNN